MKRIIGVFVLFFLAFWVLHFAFQYTSIYDNSLGLVSKNWVNKGQERYLADTPYINLTNERAIQWDAVHYRFIRDFGYDVFKADGEYIFEFFPLFPLIWYGTGLSPIGAIFLNYILFVAGLILLFKIFTPDRLPFHIVVLSMTWPGIIIFLIPYSEALFFITLSLGLYGFIKRRYWLYF